MTTEDKQSVFYANINEQNLVVPTIGNVYDIEIMDDEEEAYLFFFQKSSNTIVKRKKIPYTVSQRGSGVLFTFDHNNTIKALVTVFAYHDEPKTSEVYIQAHSIEDEHGVIVEDNPPTLFFESRVDCEVRIESISPTHAFDPIIITCSSLINDETSPATEIGFNELRVVESTFYRKSVELQTAVEDLTLTKDLILEELGNVKEERDAVRNELKEIKQLLVQGGIIKEE